MNVLCKHVCPATRVSIFVTKNDVEEYEVFRTLPGSDDPRYIYHSKHLGKAITSYCSWIKKSFKAS